MTGSGAERNVPKRNVHCRFGLSAPRHFLYPAILLLLSEEPRHGYRLVDSLLRLGFGPVDRPSVYRALADLDHDGLVECRRDTPTAGGTRNVYEVTAAGRATLETWVQVLAQEEAQLGQMVRRFGDLAGPVEAPPRVRAVYWLTGPERVIEETAEVVAKLVRHSGGEVEMVIVLGDEPDEIEKPDELDEAQEIDVSEPRRRTSESTVTATINTNAVAMS
jgi:DNA-binding PadR family transcriptional regulator